MLKKILTFVFVIAILGLNTSTIFAASSTDSVTSLRVVDVGTFNEFKYKLTDSFFTLRNDFEVSREMKRTTLTDIYATAKESYNYLPDDLINKNLYSKLEIAIAWAAKYPKNEEYYSKLIEAMDNYLENTSIQSVKGTVVATPKTGNAPLNVTLRGDVRDETGSKIPSYNYTWWVDEWGKRKVIGNKQSINYIFKEEGTFSVYLDVASDHKNAKWYTDVLPFSSRANITVKEKIASLLIEVNGDRLGTKDELKYTPEESGYGLIFDATSSTPTWGARFTRTEWDFGNGVERINNGAPEIERIKYAKEWEYTVTLKLRTNENKTVEREFLISVHDPIATITSSKEEWYLGDKFTFGAKPTGKDDDFSYEWEIIDIIEDQQVFTKTGKSFGYVFEDKWKYNIKLKVTEPSGEVDIDTKIIYINSRAPVASFVTDKPFSNKPNTLFLDASKSYDLDGKDDGNLKYEWMINGDRVELQNANYNGSTWYFTFDTVADHSVLLKVTDPEGITSQITKKVRINSILAVDFGIYPRVAQRQTAVRFVANSPEAVIYQWDFGDGDVQWGRSNQITHRYEKSWVYNVKVTVSDSEDRTNFFTKKVYVWESNAPYGFINVKSWGNQDVSLESGACYGQNAYILNRADSVTFNANESIDVTGETTGLDYTWKLGTNKYFSSASFTQKFDELGCFPIQLTVKSQSKGTTHKTTQYVKVVNLAPTLSYIDVQVVDGESDPVVVQVTAHAAKDRDGVIQSYLWYYYTDIDPEPQDFRATKLANTTFVLPKVTGNYYFVAMLKDDNEKRVSSEDITGSKYSITLTWDNINVPLVKLNVDDSSISVGQEVVFSAQVENILGQKLSNKAQYSWDLDWDGFYEKKTDSPNITYVYEKSGEFYAKVKASYKWYSNTKSLTMNVSNILKPSVEYISIGNKFILLDTSLGQVEKRIWDLWDGSDLQNDKNIIHSYNGNDGSYVVKLTLEEWVKSETQSFRVSKNVRNIIAAKKWWLVTFSNREINENIITLDDAKDKLYFYVGESKSKTQKEMTDFQVDIDTQYDSSINGGKDDDADISFSFGQNNNIFEIPLTQNKIQTIKISALDISGEVLDTQTYEIQKEYISESEIDPSNIIFTGISQSEKVTIEKIKNEVQNLPKQDRLKALMYVQKLQEEWFDAAEKTRVIVEFEWYVAGLQATNSDIIYDLLESLLLEETDDKSDQNLMFIALKNLTPTNIECNLSSDDENAVCYNAIVERLEIIKNSTDVEDNKLLWKEILGVLESYPDMSVKNKKDYKAILSSFVYGGVENMPEDEIQAEIDDNDNQQPAKRGSAITKVLKIVVWIVVIILGLFLWIFGLFYLWYAIANKDDNLWFQDFIIEKTSGKKVKITKKDDTDEILQELDGELSEPLTKNAKEDLASVLDKKQENTPKPNSGENKKPEDNKKSEVPDWLQSNTPKNSNQQKSNNLQSTQKQDNSVKQNNWVNWNKKDDWDVPDWLKGSMMWNDGNKKQEFQDSNKKEEKKSGNENIETISKNDTTNTKIESWVPSWLKNKETTAHDDAIVEVDVPKKEDWENKKSEEKEVKKQEDKQIKQPGKITDEQIEKETKLEDNSWGIPDWLKGSFDETPKATEDKPEQKSQEKKSENSENKSEKKPEVTKKATENKVADTSWDIPDWLKGSFDETPKATENKSGEKSQEKKSENSENKSEKKPEVTKKATENKAADTSWDIPDWLKGSFEETPNKSSPKEKPQEKKFENTEEISEDKMTEKTSQTTKKEVVENQTDKKDSVESKEVSEKPDEKTEKIVVEEMKPKSNQSEKNIVKVVDKKIQEDDKTSTPAKTVRKTPVKKSTKPQVEKKTEASSELDSKKESDKKTQTKAPAKKSTNKNTKTWDENPKKIDDELWDDGMKIPDWLQTEEDDKK